LLLSGRKSTQLQFGFLTGKGGGCAMALLTVLVAPPDVGGRQPIGFGVPHLR